MLRAAAYLISVLFHPLLVLTYMLVVLLLANPYLFGFHYIAEGGRLLVLVGIQSFLLPAFSIGMMRALGLVASLEGEDRRDRIGPFIATGVFYLWLFRNLYDNSGIPVAFTAAALGATIALFAAFFINLFSKISVHATGMGGLTGMIFLTMTLFSYGTFPLDEAGTIQCSMKVLLMLAIVVSGLVGTARLLLGAHRPADLYGGYALGFATQLIALKILL